MKTSFAPAAGRSATAGPSGFVCPIFLEERSGISRMCEPVKVGVPFPQGMVKEPNQVVILDQEDHVILSQVQSLARWNDGSVQWALLDFVATVGPYQTVEYSVGCWKEESQNQLPQSPMIFQEGEVLKVDTGAVCFELNSTCFKPFEQVFIHGFPCLASGKSNFVLTDDAGKTWVPRISTMEVEASGPVRATIRAEGSFSSDSQELAHFIARVNFFRESGLVEIVFTLRNSRAACHPGGLWDLGDEGSIYFKDLSLHLTLPDSHHARTMVNTCLGSTLKHKDGLRVQVYQDSSGGRNWKSTNHVNRLGQVMNTFSGYRMTIDDALVEEGDRATPCIRWENNEQFVAATIEQFWQNFPKALEGTRDQISLRLFPHQYNDVFELQGGEQKTHTLYLQFDQVDQGREGLDWVHTRLEPRSDPEWYARSKAISYLLPRIHDENKEFLQIIDTAIIGNNTFVDRREIIDEYGWRNFGELYADHEAVGHQGDSPLISHYNNQYDVINGMLTEFLRTGDHRWYRVMQDLAHHVVDIDIYHSKDDRPAYNGGMFWHTDHYFDASTATHRTFSQSNQDPKGLKGYGGGPSNEQNYTSGLLLYYFLTGDRLAFEVVQGLADWVINMDQRRSGLLGFIDRRPRGLASSSTDTDYHGPGRGGGNSINALIDGYRLTENKKYLLKAEELIRRCIHPHDHIETRNLANIEGRWSYLVFLQVLGKYLDFKTEWNTLDDMYWYAKASLLHYAEWMVKNEVPYKQVLDRVEIPTETWSAQDIRKSNVFKFAAKYADETTRPVFLQKSEFFFSSSISDLLSFKTCRLTRPLILVLVNGYMHSYFQMHPCEPAPMSLKNNEFGCPAPFTSQLHEVYKMREWVNALIGIVKRNIPSR